jgi:8-oxo-dGTP pyrophosphatase MutT (NUDIX family)
VDKTDASLVVAALRETDEEIGLKDFRILGELPSLPDRTHTIQVHPFLGVVNQSMESDIDKAMKINHDEVEYAFTMPIKDFLDPSRIVMQQFREMPGVQIPSWTGPNGESIWG